MSSYVRVLARVEAEEGEGGKSGATSPGASTTGAAPERRLRPVRSTDASELDGIGILLDNIRAHAKGGSMRTVVLSGVSSGEPQLPICTNSHGCRGARSNSAASQKYALSERMM